MGNKIFTISGFHRHYKYPWNRTTTHREIHRLSKTLEFKDILLQEVNGDKIFVPWQIADELNRVIVGK